MVVDRIITVQLVSSKPGITGPQSLHLQNTHVANSVSSLESSGSPVAQGHSHRQSLSESLSVSDADLLDSMSLLFFAGGGVGGGSGDVGGGAAMPTDEMSGRVFRLDNGSHGES